jgi:hypothetical protein
VVPPIRSGPNLIRHSHVWIYDILCNRRYAVFTTILGIPAHPLLIHAAVVFIPLLILGAIVYAAWPAQRGRITWAVLALAVIGPLAALFAKESGENLKAQLAAKGLSAPALLPQHNSYGDSTFWWTLALGLVTLAFVGYTWRVSRSGAVAGADGTAVTTVSPVMRIASTVVMLALGAVTGYYVFRTGDTGAHMVWQGV